MNAEPPSATSSSPGSGTPTNQRKERGAIAAQACETCRSRKQKCDEQRPKCGTCQKFKLECRYREPQPTKKDKTLVEILDRLKTIEGKVDNLNLRSSFTPSIYGPIYPHFGGAQHGLLSGSGGAEALTSSSLHQSGPASPPVHSRSGPYRYVSATRKMLAWPAVQQLLETSQVDLPDLEPSVYGPDVVPAMLEMQSHVQQLPKDGLERVTLEDRPSIGMQLESASGTGVLQLGLSSITWDHMEALCKAYFDTFNFLYPIMDRQSFTSDTLAAVIHDGFDNGIASTLVCLVFALGEIALADAQGIPIGVYKGRPSGVKGGTADRPPGLAFFNEARKRLGFGMTECSLENVQIYALAGLYFECCSRHLEFWRMTVSASAACHALIASNPGELSSPRADLIRRAFWHCSIMETCLNLELELPLTGLEKLEDTVGLPDFSGPFCEADYIGNQQSHFQEHFASQIVLRRLSVGFHNMLSSSIGARPFSPSEQAPDPLPTTVKQLASQLDQWRGMLPEYLRWEHGQASAAGAFTPVAHSMPVYSQSLFPSQTMQEMPPAAEFTADLGVPHAQYPYAADVQVALLRTRYYYTKYLIYRPFIYKVIHHSDRVTREDADGVVECLKACLKWPIVMSPTCHRKRMIPCLFFWTQNVLGILIMLHLSRQLPILVNIRGKLCDDRFEVEANETANLCIDWIRDLKTVDPMAQWCWTIVRGLYHLDE